MIEKTCETNLLLCPHCFKGIESREGHHLSVTHYFFDDNTMKCEWCKEETDVIHEVIF